MDCHCLSRVEVRAVVDSLEGLARVHSLGICTLTSLSLLSLLDNDGVAPRASGTDVAKGVGCRRAEVAEGLDGVADLPHTVLTKYGTVACSAARVV